MQNNYFWHECDNFSVKTFSNLLSSLFRNVEFSTLTLSLEMVCFSEHLLMKKIKGTSCVPSTISFNILSFRVYRNRNPSTERKSVYLPTFIFPDQTVQSLQEVTPKHSTPGTPVAGSPQIQLFGNHFATIKLTKYLLHFFQYLPTGFF